MLSFTSFTILPLLLLLIAGSLTAAAPAYGLAERDAQPYPESRPAYGEERQPEYRPERQPEYRPERKPEYQAERQPEYQAERQPEYRPERQPEYRPERQPEYRPESRPPSYEAHREEYHHEEEQEPTEAAPESGDVNVNVQDSVFSADLLNFGKSKKEKHKRAAGDGYRSHKPGRHHQQRFGALLDRRTHDVSHEDEQGIRTIVDEAIRLDDRGLHRRSPGYEGEDKKPSEHPGARGREQRSGRLLPREAPTAQGTQGGTQAMSQEIVSGVIEEALDKRSASPLAPSSLRRRHHRPEKKEGQPGFNLNAESEIVGVEALNFGRGENVRQAAGPGGTNVNIKDSGVGLELLNFGKKAKRQEEEEGEEGENALRGSMEEHCYDGRGMGLDREEGGEFVGGRIVKQVQGVVEPVTGAVGGGGLPIKS